MWHGVRLAIAPPLVGKDHNTVAIPTSRSRFAASQVLVLLEALHSETVDLPFDPQYIRTALNRWRGVPIRTADNEGKSGCHERLRSTIPP